MARSEKVDRYLLDGAQMHLAAFIAGTIGFLKVHGLGAKEWAAYIGSGFEGAWEAFAGAGADEVLEHLIPLQLQPLGVEVVSGSGTAQEAFVTLSPLPNRGVLDRFGTTPGGFFGALA